ncbi:M48 family metallopeptidase [Patescibacteria group bacterium]|nr:M48 family metallopeptidase [Patescibacteria group bacterium]
MKKYIELREQKVEYTLRRSARARRIRFAIYGGGEFVVTAPRDFSEFALENFMREKADWILKKTKEFKGVKKLLSSENGRHAYLTHRQTALELARKRLEHYNNIYNFTFCKIRIKSQRTCWGSCSRRKNLNFNYKLAFLPAHVADYVVVHELCHLGEMNHSKNFWNLVKKTIPDYLNIRKELRRHSLGV